MKKLEEYVKSIPDFPEKGIIFRDVTSVWQDADGLHMAIDQMQKKLEGVDFDIVLGPSFSIGQRSSSRRRKEAPSGVSAIASRSRCPISPVMAAYFARVFGSMSISQPLQQVWRQASAIQRNASAVAGYHSLRRYSWTDIWPRHDSSWTPLGPHCDLHQQYYDRRFRPYPWTSLR